MENIKHYFLSSNSCFGFYNNYKFLNSTKTPSFTYILKGGPGTGKSTFLKTVGKHFLKLGYAMEFFHCSSDPQSLDGIRIVDFNISIVDGTSPHEMNTNIPLIDSKILNLEQFIDKKTVENTKQIKQNIQKKKDHYALAYKTLKAVGAVFDLDLDKEEKQTTINKTVRKLLRDLNLSARRIKGENRQMFLSSVGSEQNFIKQNNYQRIITLNLSTNYASNVLKTLNLEITKKGYDTTSILSPLNPNIVEGIIINRRNTMLCAKTLTLPPCACLKHSDMLDTLLGEAKTHLDLAIKYHKKTEKYYTKNLNIKGINNLIKNTILEIEDKIKSI